MKQTSITQNPIELQEKLSENHFPLNFIILIVFSYGESFGEFEIEQRFMNGEKNKTKKKNPGSDS